MTGGRAIRILQQAGYRVDEYNDLIAFHIHGEPIACVMKLLSGITDPQEQAEMILLLSQAKTRYVPDEESHDQDVDVALRLDYWQALTELVNEGEDIAGLRTKITR
jgi:hypothetical protein